MNMHSLSHRTDLFFARFEGEVIQKADYTAVITPQNPDYYWGNYLIFKEPPQKGDAALWEAIFQEEIMTRVPAKHRVFTWDNTQSTEGDIKEFIALGFELGQNVALIADRVNLPPKYNEALEIRPISNDKEWHDVLENQVACREERFNNASYRPFKEKQMKRYRAMAEQGRGAWFGAYKEGQLIADLGVYTGGKEDPELGRFQSVGTHPDYRRQGACGTLVYAAAQHAFNYFGVKELVMVADEHYHAAKIYESVGFKPVEHLNDLTKYP